MDATTTTATIAPHSYCYSIKRNASAHGRRLITATVLALAAKMGHGDGSTYADCVGCGERAYVNAGPADMDAFNLGHVVADACGGVYCVCNILPLCRQCNAEMGDATLTDVMTPRYDYRYEWDGKHIKPLAPRSTPMANRGSSRWL